MKNTYILTQNAGRYTKLDLFFYDDIANHFYHPHSQNFLDLTEEEDACLISLNEYIQGTVRQEVAALSNNINDLTKKFITLTNILNKEMDDGK